MDTLRPAAGVSRTSPVVTRRLLACGAAAGPIYLVVGLAQALTREGFDMTRHPLSMLSLGDFGWVQTVNFLVAGVLVLLGAIGLRRSMVEDKRWRRGALFVGLFGIGVIGGGIFAADPSLGFPPGTPDAPPETMSWHALLHFIFGQLGFLALIIATFVFARHFAVAKLGGWSFYSAFTGTFFLASIFASVAAMGAAWSMIGLYVAVTLSWAWLSALTIRTTRETQVAPQHRMLG